MEHRLTVGEDGSVVLAAHGDQRDGVAAVVDALLHGGGVKDLHVDGDAELFDLFFDGVADGFVLLGDEQVDGADVTGAEVGAQLLRLRKVVGEQFRQILITVFQLIGPPSAP